MKFPKSKEAIAYKNYRLAIGMTATEIAGHLGVTRETISRREAGTMPISKEAWLAIQQVGEQAMEAIWSFTAWQREQSPER
jgi:transcriptional regulator with XRE-family HTH domain